MTEKRICIGVVAVASAVALICLLPGVPGAGVLFGLATMALPPALIGLAVSRNGRIGALRGPLLLFAVLLQSGFVAMLLLSDRLDPGRWWLGLPPATAVMLYGVWLAPLLAVSLIYAWHFRHAGLTDQDLDRLRKLARRRRDGDAG